jgi:hypothetical protein
VLPVVIIAAVALPILVLAFVAARRSDRAGEQRATDTDAERLEIEQEFEASERYQAEWREHEHEHEHPHDPSD